MSLEDIKTKLRIAEEAVKDIDAKLKEKAFEIILNKLFERSITKEVGETGGETLRKNKARVKATALPSGAPIPLNLKGGNGTPSLRDFFNQKSPPSSQEKIAVFVYYVNKYLKIPDVLPSHIISCYNEVNEKKSVNVPQLFKNIKHRKGWLDVGEISGSVRVNIAGENLVEHDLPPAKK